MFLLVCGYAAAHAQMRVTLVGTGGPELTPERQGEATLIEADGQTLLFDAGRSVLDGLYESRIRPQTVTRIFLTHLHSDHIEGLPGLWMSAWFLLGRKEPLQVWGPAGTAAMIDGMRAMYAHDLATRPNAALSADGLRVTVHEIRQGVVYDRDGVRVTAIPVEHADGDPAFGYRVETQQGTVLLTGDCTYGDALARQTGRVDVVISNVAAATPELTSTARVKPILAKLMSPEQAARLFEHTKPRLAVYSHIVKKGLPDASGDVQIVRRTRGAGYLGPLLVGTDHTTIIMGATVRIEHPAGTPPDFDGPDAHF
ncbi:MAG TPA: MBL fold metallo-hydrolase [Terracidiphilus sp.]|nr:MBL fold metallo-hydrolase [Terracidiphilus sp.]